MLPIYLELLLKVKIAELFGKLHVNKNNINNINTIQYKNVLLDTKNHKNNLIGKILCNNFSFYYVPIKFIEKYENNGSGIPICYHINICPFCFGIQLDIEEQLKIYDMLNNKNEILDDNNNDKMNMFIRSNFCFEMVKNNKNSHKNSHKISHKISI
jgi:hypothetical protein